MKKELLLVVIIFCSLLSSAQTATNFNKQWQDIDSLIVVKNLPKTALEKVNVLYDEAKKKGLHDEVLKALLYQFSLRNKANDADINGQLSLLKKDLRTTGDAASKAIINGMLANEMNNYYNQNVWRNQQRKETVDYKDSDITTWSNSQLIQTIDSFYTEALAQPKLLQQTDLTAITAILIKGNTPGARPTLYDIVAHEALDYYKTGLAYVTQPAYAFKLNDAHALAKANDFVQYSFSSPDTASHLLKAIQLFQQLLLFHVSDADPTAFIDVNLERIEWANNRAVFDNKEEEYKKALTDITNHFTNTKAAAEAWYALANIEANKAASYEPFKDTTHRYGYVKAKQLIEARLQMMPDTCFGNNEMRLLLANILKPQLSTEAESINVADAPFRLFIRYTNIDTLYAHVLLQKDLNKAGKKKGWSEWRDIGLLPAFKIFRQALPLTNDYQAHSVEIKMEALPPGDYTVLFSSSKAFSDETDKLATQAFTVSHLAYLRNGGDYFVVDRETGQPLKDVKASITYDVVNKKTDKQATKKMNHLYTDQSGHFSIPVDTRKYNYPSMYLTLQKGDDVLSSSDNIYTYNYSRDNDEDEDDSDYEDDHSHVYFFTDRSIYRPGQPVWYKGIATTKDRKTKQPKRYHYTDTIEVDLFDANSKVIDSQFVQVNEYGSFSGKFMLPQNVLTGEFSIETVEMDEGEANFNVEEYKRPTFYIAFDTLKGSYRLNDTITVTGFAKAYAGNAVDGAKVKYNIERSASFPYSYLFWNERSPYSNTAQIADSLINVDANGNFTIRFLAVPDSSVNAATKPLFNFAIELSVTDANGETREAETGVQVAYQSMVLQVSAPAITEAKKFNNIFITTKNNAGENIPAKVNITVSRLQTPAKAYRKRLWQQPDQFVMNKETFASFFPYNEYEKEDDYHNWKKEKTVIEDTFSTATTSSYKLPSAGLPQGWYCIEATAKDKDGNQVKDVRYVQLYDMNAAGLPSPQIAFSQVINSTGAPGDKARLLLGTSEQNVFAIIKTERSGGDAFNYVKLSNNKQPVDYTIQPTDHDAIGLYYAFVKHNNFFTGGMQVYVNNDNKQLNILYATYRNKTEPGSKETWTVQVNNSKGKKAAAELLTSLYDASLDQFKKQQWEVPYLKPYSYTGNDWNGNNFNKSGSDENEYYQAFYDLEKVYDHIAKSASELWEVYERERNKGIVMAQFKSSKIDADKENLSFENVRIGTINQAGLKSDIVVTGYGSARKKDITGAMSVVNAQSLSDTSFFNVKIRGITGISNLNTILVIIDGVVTEKKMDELDAGTIDHIDVLKGSEATALYGAKAGSGAIVITTKDFALRNGKKKEEAPPEQIRKNFSETAFFFPQLHADSAGNYSFSFTMPDAVTSWKWMSLAHTKDLAFGYKEQSIITQKTLMVQPNLPRFLRNGDSVEITAKLSNLSDSIITGTASIELLDALTLEPLHQSFGITAAAQIFTAEAGRTTVIKFPVYIPLTYTHPVTIKIIAASSRYSDGEENTLPVLSNRKLITETLPLFMKGEGEKRFVFDKLVSNRSASLTNQSLTVEYTPNPVWYVVQSLPYLMQFPHECAEQTFNRFYANVLAAYIVAKHPQIKNAFEEWSKDSTALQSNLETNAELKNILLNETPWVQDAGNETQQKKNLALLFDAVKVSNGAASAMQQLKEMQMDNGAFTWFSGGKPNRYITQYILTGIGKLMKLNAMNSEQQNELNEVAVKALRYLDKEEQYEYAQLLTTKADVTRNYLSEQDIQYWYARSFFTDKQKSIPADVFSVFVKQSDQYWTKQSPYMQGMIAIALNRLLPIAKPLLKFKNTPLAILHSLKENAVIDSSKGAYWKANEDGYYWYQSSVEAQALLINAFEEITPDDSLITAISQWLILNKQTNSWATTKATADACYALLQGNGLDSSQSLSVSIKTGDSTIAATTEKTQARTGYLKHRIEGKNVVSSMGNITVSVSKSSKDNTSSEPSYGAVYWQYFEDMDKITAAASPLSVSKKLFIEKNTGKGKILQPVTTDNVLKVGDKIVIQLIMKSDREMDYIQLSDMRASSMEPVHVLSEYKWQDGLGYYESTRDASVNFFIDHLPKGTYVFEYPVYITHTGSFSAGIATVQCMYAPQFSAHSEGMRIRVETMHQ